MEFFVKTCILSDLNNNKFFLDWHQAIKRDLEIFKLFLSKYEDSVEKNDLISKIIFIQNNLCKSYDDDTEIILKSTPNYFLYSFFEEYSEIPSYVLVSKDYKRLLIASEEMECFDDIDFDEDERYGTYNYDFYKLDDNKVYHYNKYIKEYTNSYNKHFHSYMYSDEYKQTEKYYDIFLKEFENEIIENQVRRLTRK